MPEISVLMGTYNEEDTTLVAQAIDSILSQTFTDFEFIICDDGSDWGFYGWLESYCRKDARILLLRSRTNRGLADTLNRCFRHAKGKYIARMDADDISQPRRFEKQAAFLEAHPEYALAGCNVCLFDDQGIWGTRRMELSPQKRSFLCTSPFVHPAVMMRREVMEALCGYSTEKRAMRTEDYEFFMRLYAADYAGYNLPEVLFSYREDRRSYRKRKYRWRVNECRVRYAGFKNLGILRGNVRYVLKPLAVGLIPRRVMMKIRRCRYAGKTT